MKMKGMDEFRRHVPDLQTAGGAIRFGALLAAVFLLVTLFFIWVDHVFAEWMPDGEIVFIALGFLILARFYSRKHPYQMKYSGLAYRNALVRFYIPGFGILCAAIVHLIYMPGPEIPHLWWKAILIIIGWYLVLAGLTLSLRTVQTTSLDHIAKLNVYFPEEGPVPDSGIYSFLRHPLWAGLLQIGIGFGLISGGWFSLLVALLLPLGFIGWVRLVEEKELLQRLGQNYADYRKRTPAFWVRPGDLIRFARFLLNGT